MIDFKLPSLGADMDEGTLLEWRIKPGDTVRRGQVIAVVDTAKAAVEVECWQDGEVFELLIEPGAKVPVGTPIASLLETGESAASARLQAPRKPLVEPVAPVLGGRAEAVAPASRPRVSPAARKRAGELGLDPAALTGSGPHCVVTLEDVEAAGRAPAPATERGPSDRQAAMRQAIAAAMSRSKREIPHYYLSETIALGQAMAWLQARNARSTPEERLLPGVLLLKAVALALREYPQLNGFWREGAFQPAGDIHLGVAIALRQGGLIAPALHAVASKPLEQLMGELSDASLTVTQLGDQGVDAVFGVIYPPQVALVGFGRIAERPWVEAGQLCVMPCVVASLAADHRVSDGHYGARFLGEVRRLLQQPDSL